MGHRLFGLIYILMLIGIIVGIPIIIGIIVMSICIVPVTWAYSLAIGESYNSVCDSSNFLYKLNKLGKYSIFIGLVGLIGFIVINKVL